MHCCCHCPNWVRLPVHRQQMAQVQLEVGRAWDAIQSASRAVEINPGFAAAHMTLARAQLALGEPELAETSLEAALRLAPENDEAAAELKEVRALVQQREAAGGPRGRRLHVRDAAGSGSSTGADSEAAYVQQQQQQRRQQPEPPPATT